MRYLALTLLLVAAGAAFLFYRTDQTDQSEPTTATDPVELFQKAFWKRPAADDQLLHVARHGARWFLAVRPSGALTKHLHEAFLLVPGTATPLADAPEWFHAQGAVLRSTAMQLCWMENGTLLYATGTTTTPQAGLPLFTPAPSEALTQTSRLPLTSPPPVSQP